MKKICVIATVACAALMMGACGGNSQKVPFDNGDSIEVLNADPTIYGVCGEETAMNSMQLITDMGDTLSIDISGAQESGQVYGGIQVGDRMAVLPDSVPTRAAMVINQATLLGNWVMPNPIDGSDEVGISIKEGGIAEGIDQSNTIYKTWRIVRGKLEIVLVREGGSEEDETYLYDLLKLDADSLVFRLPLSLDERKTGVRDEDETFRYGRQKAKTGYGREIELEDASKEDFML